MPYTIREVSQKAQLDGIVDVIWAAMDGVDPSHQVFYPVLGEDLKAREAAISESKERKWQEHINDPSSHWIFVTEDGSLEGKVIAGCQWRIYTENPFSNGTPTITATWWPEGTGREFASEVVRQCYTPRTIWMARPHTGLSDMCVLPELQHQGIGKAMMDWGLERTDELGLESFIEGTPPGMALYSKCGFAVVKEVRVDMSGMGIDKGQEWRSLEKQKLPIGYTATWRPKKGIMADGELEKTWAERLGG